MIIIREVILLLKYLNYFEKLNKVYSIYDKTSIFKLNNILRSSKTQYKKRYKIICDYKCKYNDGKNILNIFSHPNHYYP